MIPATHHSSSAASAPELLSDKGRIVLGDRSDDCFDILRLNLRNESNKKNASNRTKRKLKNARPAALKNAMGAAKYSSLQFMNDTDECNHIQDWQPIPTQPDRAPPVVGKLGDLTRHENEVCNLKENDPENPNFPPQLVIPYPTSLQDSDRFGSDQSERTISTLIVQDDRSEDIPRKAKQLEVSTATNPRLQQDRTRNIQSRDHNSNNVYLSQSNSPPDAKLESKTNEDTNASQICDENSCREGDGITTRHDNKCQSIGESHNRNFSW